MKKQASAGQSLQENLDVPAGMGKELRAVAQSHITHVHKRLRLRELQTVLKQRHGVTRELCSTQDSLTKQQSAPTFFLFILNT